MKIAERHNVNPALCARNLTVGLNLAPGALCGFYSFSESLALPGRNEAFLFSG